MKLKTDFPWHNAKKIISDEINEITLVSGCSVSDRNDMVSNGIYSYKEISNPFTRNSIDIDNTLCLDIPKNKNVLFIDFEVLTSVYDNFENFPESNNKTYIFNIGAGYNSRNKFLFKSYMAKDLTEEYKIISEFSKFINSFSGKSIMLVHWTDIEKRLLISSLKTYNITINKQIIWFDLHNYFKTSKVYIKGCLNYKLKFVSRSLYDKNLISSSWESTFADGLGAMTGYIKYISTIKKDENILKEIAHYNMIDCRVLWEIYNLLLSIMDK
jgi:predicted RecB family nuclease